MTQQTHADKPETHSERKPGWRAWSSPRRKRFWGAVVVVLYTLSGFLGVPVAVKSAAIKTLHDSLGRTASIERVRFNPYVLSLEVNGFVLLDPDGVTLAEFDRFFANLQLSSLFRWAWTFRELSLEGLDARFERFAPGDSRLTRLLADRAVRAAPEPATEQDSGGLPRLLIHNLDLKNGSIHFRDDVPADPVELLFGPVDVSIQQLNTLPDRDGRQRVTIALPHNARIEWQGSIDLAPLRSEGTLSVENSRLDQTIAYLKALLPLDSIEAVLSLQTNYRLNEMPDGSVDVALDALQGQLKDVTVSGLAPVTEFLALTEISVSGGSLRYPQSEMTFDSIRIRDPRLVGWVDERGQLSLQQLQTPDSEASDAGGADADSPAAAEWRLGLGELAVENAQIEFEDRSIRPAATVGLQNVAVSVRDISNEENAVFPVSVSGGLSAGGELAFDGEITALPEFSLRGAATAGALSLTLAQPYAQQQLNILIEDGLLDLAADLALESSGAMTAGGRLDVTNLRIADTRENLPLVGWERLVIDRFEAATESGRLELSLVTLDQPFGRLVINEDLSTNLTGLLATAEGAAPDDAAPAAVSDTTETAKPAAVEADSTPIALVIGGTRIRDGAMDFSDLSLPLPFATEIRQMNGTISTLNSSSAAPAEIRLEGQVDEYGLARIEGAMNLFDPVHNTDVTMEFRNLLMSSLSPYSVEFAGRKIDEGKLNLDLKYRIQESQLQGQNKVVMSDLVLGDEVDNPDAMSLPLGLAVALLTDANGVIDIDLPVQGDINDPEFAIGGVILKAFVGLVTKIVSAPFRLLGSLIGVESEDFGQFQFLGGRSDLTPPELEKIAQLREALQQRPELGVKVSGAFAPAVDVPALQFQRLRSAVLERVAPEYAEQAGDFQMLDERIQDALEALFIERNPDLPVESVKAAHLAPPPDDPEGAAVFDSLAYASDIRDRLLAGEQISRQDLEGLANARAAAISSAFLASGGIEESRIVLAEPVEVEGQDDAWVTMELGVVAD
jgi:hypothetical protein